MKNIQIGDMQDEHIEAVASLLMHEFNFAWNTLEQALEEAKEALQVDCISRILLNDQDEVIGMIGGRPQYDGNVWEMHPLVIKKEVQNQGYGKLLVDDFENEIKKRGGITILLGTDDEDYSTTLGGSDLYTNLHKQIERIQNLKNHPYAFYQKCGYQIVGVIPDANGVGKPDILMAKRVFKN